MVRHRLRSIVVAVLASAPACKSDAPAPFAPTAVTRQQNYVVRGTSTEIEIDPSDGARIVALRLGAANVLVDRDETPDAYGSSLWLSPQSEWGWPPPKEIATSSYAAKVDGKVLVLEGRTYPKLDISVTKRISQDAGCDCALLVHTLTNRGTKSRKSAPWLNSRVRPGGLTFYPTSGPAEASSTLNLDTSGDVTFYQHDRQMRTQGLKSFADGREGWLAHVSGDLLFVQSFPDVAKEAQAPGEGEIEIYVDGGGRFVEIEEQGPYAEIPAGGKVDWTVRWYLRKIPPGVEVKAGSRALVDLVRSTLKTGT